MKDWRHRQARAYVYALSALAGLGITSPAFGQSEASTTRERLLAAQRPRGIHLDSGTGTLLGIEGYSGLTVLAASDRRRGHLLSGGLLRARIGYFEFGGFTDRSDYADGRWRSLGGFAGVYLPYVNWVDVDATAGLAYRRHENREPRYGAHGAVVTVPALTLRLGISQRSNPGLFAVRLGAALFAQIDLARKDVFWDYQLRGRTIASGETSFGGTTVGMQMNLGFDLSFRPSSPE